MRFGAGPNGPMRTLGQYMLGSAATFGYGCASMSPSQAVLIVGARFFMSIGSVIRTEGRSPMTAEAYARARRQPIIMPRQYNRRPGDGR